MGLFPYNCDKCRGGDFRCGTTYCQPCCKGGQTCWEEEMVMILTIQDKRIQLSGKYDGYGTLYYEDDSVNGPIQYEGQFKQGLADGKGKHYSDNELDSEKQNCKRCGSR